MYNIDKLLHDIEQAIAKMVQEPSILLAFIPVTLLNTENEPYKVARIPLSIDNPVDNNIETALEDIRLKMANGYLKRDLLLLLGQRKESIIKLHREDIIFYSAKLSFLEDEINKGTISHEDKEIYRNKLIMNILTFLKKLSTIDSETL